MVTEAGLSAAGTVASARGVSATALGAAAAAVSYVVGSAADAFGAGLAETPVVAPAGVGATLLRTPAGRADATSAFFDGTPPYAAISSFDGWLEAMSATVATTPTTPNTIMRLLPPCGRRAESRPVTKSAGPETACAALEAVFERA